jgi:6,7-dimethyl-8-ribityllumazine synthase
MNADPLFEPAPLRIALVVSRFNTEITDGLKAGALSYLATHDITVAPELVIAAPGAFEMPLIAQALARSGRVDGVVCLGCVIKGDTAHFEFISAGATLGLMQAGLATGVPIGFGVLTTYTEAQADVRSRDDPANKGREAAAAVVETALILRAIKSG